MVALLVAMSVAAVLMTAVMPTWKQTVQREKEAELIFRGQQYVRAIELFQKRAGPGVLPPNLDVLVSGRFLRKKYKDPITGDDFDLISPVQNAGGPGQTPGTTTQPATAVQGRGAAPSTGTVGSASQPAGRGGAGGIIGVASKSKAASIRLYNGRTHYNEWQFVFVQQTQQPGTPGLPGRGGGRGNPAAGPGGGTPGAVGPGRGRGAGPGGGRGITPFGSGGRGTQQQPPPSSPFQPQRPPG
jgi:type II secretory pathway pseudopilin PulG